MSDDTKRAEHYIALLRGVNVGGKNKLPMKELAALLTELGCSEVKTYIQSGNVVYKAGRALAGRLPKLIEEAIGKRFGLRVPVVVRTEGELRAIAANNPFLRAGGDPDHLHVAFLADEPSAVAVAALDPQRSPPDEFVVLGKEIFLSFPEGLARTKLSNAYFDAKLATTSTMRNWRTLLKLIELTEG